MILCLYDSSILRQLSFLDNNLNLENGFNKNSSSLGNKEKFSIQQMANVLDSYLSPMFNVPKETKLILPKLNKIK